MRGTKTSLVLPIAISLLGITFSTCHAAGQSNVIHEQMVQRKTEQVCGSDNACIERIRARMNKRYEDYREIRLRHCKNDKKCKDDFNKKFPKKDSKV